jgi:GAF domain-containing protein
VDLQQYKTVVDGDRAYPLVARGEMLGVLVCGTRNRREPYAPDEADALVRVASGVGVALDTLRDGKADGLSRLQGTLDQILDQLRTLNARVNGDRPKP